MIIFNFEIKILPEIVFLQQNFNDKYETFQNDDQDQTTDSFFSIIRQNHPHR